MSDQLKIYKELSKYNANICINTVVHKGNIKDAENLCKLINSLDCIKKWQLFKYAPMGKYGFLNKDLFEISEDEFRNYQKEILSNSKKKEIIEFKGYNVRNKAYMLIDNSGNAWIPVYNQKSFDNYKRNEDKRNIIGNITKKTDWEKIIFYLKGD